MEKTIQLPLDASLFSWTDYGGSWQGVAEASTLGYHAGHEPYAQIWNDSMDVGLVLRNPKTGNEETFIYEKYDNGAWHFSSYKSDKKMELRVFND